MRRSHVVDEINRLDPDRDYFRICYLSQCYDFPFEALRSAEFGLFKAYCVPAMAALLVSTRQIKERPQSRYDNTLNTILGVIEYGPDSPEGHALLRHMNRVHHHYPIDRKDFRYTIAASVMETVIFNRRWGWRPFTANETRAYFNLWRDLAHYMNVQPYFDSFEELERYYDEYEAREFRYSPNNQLLAEENVALFVSWYPRLLAPLTRRFALTMLGAHARRVCGLPHPSPLAQALVIAAMKLRALVLARLPARTEPFHFTRQRHRTFPTGFSVDQLPKFEHVPSPDHVEPSAISHQLSAGRAGGAGD